MSCPAALSSITGKRYRFSAGVLMCVVAGTAAVAAGTDLAAEPRRHHALSLVGTPKYGPEFAHFDWVNPDAPKGGNLRQRAIGSFDTLNEHASKGSRAMGLTLITDSLMAPSLDEPSTEYGLIAEWVSMPDDISSATFGLRASRLQSRSA
jgi:microcin C transport system substrate-binding protein